ncbi:MAG: argininosuccinate lyase [Deltaproteobacteria bacterium]|nr:argininosuccinate lyase [Deltaproteobacteria bacterium]
MTAKKKKRKTKYTNGHTRLWGGRFEKATAKEVLEFTESISFDRRLALFDVAQSLAHVQGLRDAKLLTDSETRKLSSGLTEVAAMIHDGRLEMRLEHEDIHTAIEKALTAIVGNVGGKLHTARSRNDQVATDLKLYLREATKAVCAAGLTLIATLEGLAHREAETVMPGYTHLQRAMPVTLGHHLAAYAFMFTRDVDRFIFGLNRANSLPLGAGALAGTNHAIDREHNAARLGFARVDGNSLDAVSSRDFVADFISSCAIMQMHLSRLSEDIILWCSSEFGYAELDDAFATGSSLMPQKKNPDVAELVRGKSARVFGNLMGCLTLLKGLPLSYNRDLQEDKIFLFDSVDTLAASLGVMAKFLASLKFRADRMRKAVESDPAILATDLADALVRAGVPFRKTHEIVGTIVRHALSRGIRLQDLSDRELRKFSADFPPGTAKGLTVDNSVRAKQALGGPSPDNIRRQCKQLRKFCSSAAKFIEETV